MKQIPLTQGQYALVDDADYGWLALHKWHAQWHPQTRSFYAIRTVRIGPKRERRAMHRVILGLTDPHIQSDHKNGDTLDNRRENLRPATHSENARNRCRPRTATSAYKGVYWKKDNRKWGARIAVSGKDIHLGYFSDPAEASAAYQKAAEERHGAFARFQ